MPAAPGTLQQGSRGWSVLGGALAPGSPLPSDPPARPTGSGRQRIWMPGSGIHPPYQIPGAQTALGVRLCLHGCSCWTCLPSTPTGQRLAGSWAHSFYRIILGYLQGSLRQWIMIPRETSSNKSRQSAGTWHSSERGKVASGKLSTLVPTGITPKTETRAALRAE